MIRKDVRKGENLYLPGSDSSALTTRKEGRPSDFLGMKDHFSPEGKPAPPRPRKPEAFSSFTIQSGPWFMMSLVRYQSPLFMAAFRRQSLVEENASNKIVC